MSEFDFSAGQTMCLQKNTAVINYRYNDSIRNTSPRNGRFKAVIWFIFFILQLKFGNEKEAEYSASRLPFEHTNTKGLKIFKVHYQTSSIYRESAFEIRLTVRIQNQRRPWFGQARTLGLSD